jgi:adenylylsulfate kinase
LNESFCEVYVKCDIDECIRRDPKGLYARAKSGAIQQFTGISAPYEAPEHPDVLLDTQGAGIEGCLEVLEAFLRSHTAHTDSI